MSFATATESPDSPSRPRSLAQEVDHIKSLLSRSHGAPRQSEGMITAQIFRRASISTEPVSQTRILHELDSLKRRIRQEQTLIRRPSHNDPDTESEDDVPDEREEELDSLHRELAHERTQREEWLTSAEHRVDILTSERDGLSEQVDQMREELEDVRQSKDELAASLAERNEKMNGLEENNRATGQQLQRIISEHKSREEESQRTIKTLQDSHQSAQRNVESSRTKIEELEKNAADHDIRRRDLIQQLDEHRKLLANAKKDIDLHGKELTQLLKQHQAATAQAKELTQERDEHKTKYDALLVEKDVAVQSKEDDHRGVLKALTDGHEAQLKKLKDQLDETKTAHTSELNSLRSAHARELATLEHNASKADDERASMKSTVTELSDRLAKAEEHNAELQQTLQDKEESHQKHVKMAEESMAEMEQRLLSAEKQATDAEASLKTKELDLSSEISTKDNQLADAHGQLSELQQKLYDLSAELDGKNAELSVAAEEKIKLEESGKARETELRQKHDSTMEALKDSHKSAISEVSTKHQDAERQLAELKAQHASTVDELKDSHQSAISDVSTKHQDAERQLTELKAKHASEIMTIKTDHEQSASRPTSEQQSFIAQLKTDLAQAQEAMEAVNRSSAEKISRLQAEHEQRIRELESGWSSKADEATRSHQADMQSAANEASDQLARAREESQKQIDEHNADADARLAGLREEHADELGKIQEDLQSKLREAESALDAAKHEHESASSDADDRFASLREEHAAELAKIREDHESKLRGAQSALGEAKREHESTRDRGNDITRDLETKTSELERLREDHAKELQDAQNALTTSKEEMERKHAETLRDALGNASREHEQNMRTFEDKLAEAEKASGEKMTARDSQHYKEVQDLESKYQSELEALRQDHDESSKAAVDREVEAVRSSHRDELDALHRTHEESLKAAISRELDAVRTSHQAELDELRRSHEADLKATVDRELNSVGESHQAEVDTLHQTHEQSSKAAIDRELDTVRSSHRAELDSLRRTHEESTKAAIDQELDTARSNHQSELAAVHKGSENAISQIREESDHEMQRRLAKLEEEHESALAAALANADEELDDRLRAQSKAHSKQFDKLQESLHGELESLQMQLEEATELRLVQTQQADADSQKSLAELGEKLKAAEQTSVGLQARLDFELTGRAESERSLAELRKQRFEEEKKTTESRETLQKQIDTLLAEKTALSKRASAIFIPRDIGSPIAESSSTGDAAEDVSDLKKRLTMAEEEREQARVAGQQESEEKSELARQNEFLVKELETLMATRSAEAASTPVTQDASAQTDFVEVISEGDYPQAIREQKSDRALSTAAKQRRSARPVTPLTPKQNVVNGTPNGMGNPSSFEQYLEHAQAELSELGSVISSNEALFAQKIQEHFGDLKRAKDQINIEYDAKFRALEAEKAKMESDFSAKNAAEFVRERKQLVASYGADHDEPDQQAAAVTSLPSPQRRELRSAEEQLVSKYNRRVVKRKSQIALKHAEDYQSLAQDFDRRLAELLGNKAKLESDLSVEPSKFEHDLGEFEAISAQMEHEKASNSPDSPRMQRFSRDILAEMQSRKPAAGGTAAVEHAPRSQLPRRTVSAMPRSTTSIPRAVPFPGNRESGDFTTQQHRPRRSEDVLRSASERHTPTLQHSPRTRNSPSVATPKHIATNPRSSERSPLQVAKSKFSVEPSKTEQTSPQDTVKHSPHAARSARNKDKSRKHSSRVIFGDWQATNDI